MKNILNELAAAVGGEITEVSGPLPDGSGFATMSVPLPKDHWLYGDGSDRYEPPPMVLRTGTVEDIQINGETLTRDQFAQKIRAAGKYAVRSATMSGKEMDFDPDALLQNLVVGMLGYWTADGLSSDEWANPPHHEQERDEQEGDRR